MFRRLKFDLNFAHLAIFQKIKNKIMRIISFYQHNFNTYLEILKIFA